MSARACSELAMSWPRAGPRDCNRTRYGDHPRVSTWHGNFVGLRNSDCSMDGDHSLDIDHPKDCDQLRD